MFYVDTYLLSAETRDKRQSVNVQMKKQKALKPEDRKTDKD